MWGDHVFMSPQPRRSFPWKLQEIFYSSPWYELGHYSLREPIPVEHTRVHNFFPFWYRVMVSSPCCLWAYGHPSLISQVLWLKLCVIPGYHNSWIAILSGFSSSKPTIEISSETWACGSVSLVYVCISLSVCMYVCVYMSVCLHVFVHVFCVCMCIYIWVCVCVYLYVYIVYKWCMYVYSRCIWVYMYIYLCMCICVYISVNAFKTLDAFFCIVTLISSNMSFFHSFCFWNRKEIHKQLNICLFLFINF